MPASNTTASTSSNSHAWLTQDKRIIILILSLALGNLSINLHRSSRVYLLQQSQCLNYYAEHDPSKLGHSARGLGGISAWWNGPASSSAGRVQPPEESLCKGREVQAPLSVLEGVDMFCAVLPGLVMLPIYQKLLPTIGLRHITIFSMLMSSCLVCFSTLAFSFHKSWATIGILLPNIFELIGGGDVVRIVACVTCIADIMPSEHLAKAYNYATALCLLGSVSASLIGSLLLSHHVYILNLLSLLSFTFSIFFAFLIPAYTGRRSNTPKTVSDTTTTSDSILLDSASSSRSSSPDPSSYRQNHPNKSRNSKRNLLLTAFITSLKALPTLFSVPNPTFTILLLWFFSNLAARSEVLLSQYISLTLQWPLATVNAALAAKAFVASSVLFILPTLRERYLAPRYNATKIDFLISRASFILFGAGMTVLGFPLPTPLFVATLCAYTAGIGVKDSLSSLGKATLPTGGNADTANGFFLRVGLIDSISGLAGAPVWSAVFNVCLRVEWLPLGTPFWIAGAIFVVCVVMMGRLKRWTEYKLVSQP